MLRWSSWRSFRLTISQFTQSGSNFYHYLLYKVFVIVSGCTKNLWRLWGSTENKVLLFLESTVAPFVSSLSFWIWRSNEAQWLWLSHLEPCGSICQHKTEFCSGATPLGYLGQPAGPIGQWQHREQGLGYPPQASLTWSPSQTGPVAVSSLLAHLPLAGIKPFPWLSRLLVLQRHFLSCHLTNAVADCRNVLTLFYEKGLLRSRTYSVIFSL